MIGKIVKAIEIKTLKLKNIRNKIITNKNINSVSALKKYEIFDKQWEHTSLIFLIYSVDDRKI